MYIQRQHYLHLLKQNEELTANNQLLQHQNTLLAQELQRLTVAHLELIQKFAHMEGQIAACSHQVMAQNDSHHSDIKGSMAQIAQQHRNLLQTKFAQLQTSSFQKYKVLEIKSRVNRIENHQLLAFVDSLKKIYFKNAQAQQQPSLKDLTKWVRQLAAEKSKAGEKGSKEETDSSWKQNRKIKQ